MVRFAPSLLLLLAACSAQPSVFIVGHRALGLGVSEENRAANVEGLFRAGFGAEIDIRGDGEAPFTLGHLRSNGDTLAEVFDRLEAAWDPSFAEQVLLLDIANDQDDTVSNDLISYLFGRVGGSVLTDLPIIVQSSNIESLARLQGAYRQRGGGLQLRFALTYWLSTEYTTPGWIDLVTGNVSSMGEMPHPKPVALFGVDTRASFRRAVESRNDVIGVITNHPRRIAEICGCR